MIGWHYSFKARMTKHFLVKILFIVSAMSHLGISLAASPKDSTPTAAISSVLSKALQSSEEKIQASLASVNERLNTLEVSITKASERANNDRGRAAWFALATVAISGILSLLAQWLLMRHQRSMNQEQSQAEVSNSYVEWQLKQLSELYGPLRALLGQSNAMYRQMNRALAAAAPKMFKLRKEEGADFDNEVFEIFHDGQWTRFRTVKHLGEVYNKEYGVEPYFDDVVDVGARMANLIRDKAGYVQPSDKELIEVMGSYLAHYSVFSRLHKRAKDGEPLKGNKADETAAFPIAIQKLVNDGFEAINEEVMDWKSNGRKSARKHE